jgi:hypothetical protein
VKQRSTFIYRVQQSEQHSPRWHQNFAQSEYWMLSSRWFAGVWCLYANVSKHSISSSV